MVHGDGQMDHHGALKSLKMKKAKIVWHIHMVHGIQTFVDRGNHLPVRREERKLEVKQI